MSSVLEHNVARLLARAYRPERPSVAWRAQLVERLEAQLSGAVPQPQVRPILRSPARPALSPIPALQRWWPLAAGLLFLLGAWFFAQRALDGAKPGTRGSEPVAEGPAQFEPGGTTPAPRRAAPADPDAERTLLPAPVQPANGPELLANSDEVLRGRVFAAEGGAPLEGVLLHLLPAGSLFQPAEPESRPLDDAQQGVFEWGPLERGRYLLFAYAQDRATLRVELDWPPRAPAPLELGLETGFAVHGRVFDSASGLPIAGALVLSETDVPASMVPVQEQELLKEREYERFVRTAPDGSFRIEHLSRQTQVLRVLAPGLGTSWSAPIEAPLADSRELATALAIGIQRGGRVHGVVRDELGAPLPNHLVISALNDFNPERRMSYALATTDALGQYAAEALPPGFQVLLLFGPGQDEGAAPLCILPALVKPGGDLCVNFPAGEPGGATLEGRVLDARGQPVAGLSLSLQPADSADPTRWRSAPLAADGSFTIDGLAGGAWDIAAGGGNGASFSALERVELPASGRMQRDFVLAEGSLRGELRDGAQHQALAGLVVLLRQLEDGSEDFVARIYADREGRFEAAWLPAGRYRALVYDLSGACAILQTPAFELAHAQALDLGRLELPEGLELLLRVEDLQGRPVEDARFELLDEAGSDKTTPHGWGFGPHSDAQGLVRIRGLCAGRWRVRALLDSSASDWSEIALTPGAAATDPDHPHLVLRLPAR